MHRRRQGFLCSVRKRGFGVVVGLAMYFFFFKPRKGNITFSSIQLKIIFLNWVNHKHYFQTIGYVAYCACHYDLCNETHKKGGGSWWYDREKIRKQIANLKKRFNFIETIFFSWILQNIFVGNWYYLIFVSPKILVCKAKIWKKLIKVFCRFALMQNFQLEPFFFCYLSFVVVTFGGFSPLP